MLTNSRPVVLQYAYMTAIILAAAQLADLLTFAAASTLHPISGEANVLAGGLYAAGGLLAVGAGKLLGLACMLWYVLAGMRFARGIALTGIGAGVLGVLVNVLALGQA